MSTGCESLNLLATIRNRLHRRTHRILAGFGVVWFAFAFQPCAMALGGEKSHYCPHCPTEVQQACGGASAEQCANIDAVSHDGRTLDLKPNDAPKTLLPIPIKADAGSLEFFGSVTRFDSVGPALYGPPLNIHYCVFLE